MLSTGSRASTPLKKQADGIREKLADLGEDAAGVRACICRVRFGSAGRWGGRLAVCRCGPPSLLADWGSFRLCIP